MVGLPSTPLLKKLCTVLLLLLLISINVPRCLAAIPPQESKGVIYGRVVDEQGAALPIASVMIQGTTQGTASDLDGYFSLSLTPGHYALVVSMISYETTPVPSVIVKAGDTTRITVRLKEARTQLDEIVVVGDPVFGASRIVHTDDVALVDKMKTSALNITGISTQQIIRSADNNASDVVKRAASVTVIDDFVLVRGLPERYNFTFINGMQAPSSKPDGRAFSFDLMPSGMIDNILIYRSPAPELPADFAGGVVDITTRQSIHKKQLVLSGALSYRQNTTNEQQYHVKSPSNTDQFGYDDGSRGLPKGFPKDIPYIGTNASARDLQLAGIAARSLMTNWNLYRKSVQPDLRYGLNYYDSWRIGAARLSSATSLNYTATTQFRSQTFLNSTRTVRRAGTADPAIYDIEPTEYYKDTVSINTHRLGGFQSFNLKLNERHSLLLNGFFNQDGNERIIMRKGYNVNSIDELDTWPTRFREQVSYRYQSRTIFTGFLKGSHAWQDNRHTLSWLGGYTHSYDNLPSERMLTYYKDTTDQTYIIKLFAEGFSQTPATMFFREVEENINTGRADYKRELPKGMHLKVGGFYEHKERTYFSKLYYYTTNSSSNLPGIIRQLPYPFYEKADSLMNQWLQEDGSGLTLAKAADFYNYQFSSSTTLTAGYLGFYIPFLSNKLTLYTGVRYEHYDQQITPQGLDDDTSPTERNFKAPTIKTQDFFPSVNLTYQIKENLKLRTSYGLTLNRPFERELSGAGYYDFVQGYSVVGYRYVKPAKIQNADMRLEMYGGDGEMIALGLFYKHFKNPIELLPDDVPDIYNSQFLADEFYTTNTKSAQNYGVEFEFRKNLSFITERLRNISFIVNASVLHSRVQLSDSLNRAFYNTGADSVIIRKFVNAPGGERSLTGTSPYTFNAALYYDSKKTSTTLSLQYNVIGPRIIIPPVIQIKWGNIPYADPPRSDIREFFSPGMYEAPRHLIDFTLRQKLLKFLAIKFSVQNILNQPVRLFMDLDQNEKYTPPAKSVTDILDGYNQDFMRIKYHEGRYYTVGLSIVW